MIANNVASGCRALVDGWKANPMRGGFGCLMALRVCSAIGKTPGRFKVRLRYWLTASSRNTS